MLKLVKYYALMSLMVLKVLSLESAFAMDDSLENQKVLVIGARPWDKNIEDLKIKEYAHFLDFNNHGYSDEYAKRYHQYDINHHKVFDAPDFQVFAQENTGKYPTIIVDFATFQHVRRKDAWEDISILSPSQGGIIIPVASFNSMTKKSSSKEEADRIADQLKEFCTCEIVKFDTIRSSNEIMQTYPCLELLTSERQGFRNAIMSMEPVIIFATKK
jgi:hypothetical protein